MTIGIDLSALQGAHRMRGIGYTLINLINNISEADRKKHRFIFYVYPLGEYKDPLELLNLQHLNYEVREIKPCRRINKKLPGRLNLFVSFLNQVVQLRDLYFGDSRIKDLQGIDFFLQSDQSQHLPRSRRNLKKGLIIYDIIPYVLEWEYLWSYGTARKHGFSHKAALRVWARRWLYIHKVKLNTAHADILFSISEHTKKDFVKYIGIKANKITVTPLGVNLLSEESKDNLPLRHYIETGWGYIERKLRLDPSVPFILYVGGADKRRKLQDLITAFNLLRAEGQSIKLVLAGDCMQGPNNIATEEIQYALNSSSYKDDIIFMGFIDDQTRDWLYHHALVFVFPSRYEGFGLPVLEAMSYGTPVISYYNAAIQEVADKIPAYANNVEDLRVNILRIFSCTPKEIEKLRHVSISHAQKFSWVRTSTYIFSLIENTKIT